MITINLLPPDKRYTGKTDVKLQLGIGGGALLALLGFFWYAYIHWHSLPAEEEALRNAQNINKQCKAQADKLALITPHNDQYDKILAALIQCRSKRVHFSKKLYELAEVFQDQPIWMNNLSVTPVAPPADKTKKAGTLTGAYFLWSTSCVCVSDTPETITNFLRKLRDSTFFKNFQNLQWPGGYTQANVTDAKQVTKTAWNFNITMTMVIPPPEFKGK